MHLMCVLMQSPQTPSTECVEEDPLFREALGLEDEQAVLAEISEQDIEVLRQREEALLQIEVSVLKFSSPSLMLLIRV